MKRLLWIVAILLLSISASAQVSGPARKIAFGTADPASCQTNGNNIFFRTDTGQLKVCTAANTWSVVGAGAGSGDVNGPASATDNAIARFDGTGGKTIQNSVVTIADTTGNMAGVGTINTHTIPGGTGTFALIAATQTFTNKTYDTAGTGNVFKINGAQVTSIGSGLSIAAGVLDATGGGGGGMSIGGTVTSGTIGSIPFIGAGPVLAQDNATFFWDTTNKRLGIGTTAPASALDVQGFMSLGALNTEGQGIYLASCFTNTQALYLVASNDGKTFNFLNSNDPTTGAVYTPVSPSIVRDPSIMKSGGLYWVAHTNNFGGTTFDVISSPDLSNWTLVQSVDMSAVTGVNRVYAPEWFVDTDGSIHIFVTTSIDTGVSYQIHEVHPTNAAMTTWSTPVTVTGTGIPASAIDPFILKLGSNYQLWYSNQPTNSFIEVATSTSLTSGYTALHTGDWNSWGNTIEGPNIVQTGTNTYRLYVDHFPSLGIKYAESTDGGSTWGALTAITVPGVIVHPTIIRIRDVDALRNMAGLFMARNASVNGPFTASAVTTTNGSVVSASHVISGANLYLGTGADAYLILGATSTDTIIGRAAADNFRLGKLAANPPIAQTLSMQNASGTNIAGADFTLDASQGTGTGTGGSLILKVAPAGSTGSSLNALATAFTILSTKKATFADDLTVSGLLKTGSGPTTLTDAAGLILSAALNTVGVAQGGTGLTTLTANNVILGNGTSAPTFVAPGTSGNVLTSNGTTWTSAAASGGGSGTVNSGTQYRVAYYATTGTAVSGNGSLVTDASDNWTLSNKLGVGIAPSTNRAMTLMDMSGGATYFQFKQASTAETTIGVESSSKQFLIFKESNSTYMFMIDPANNVKIAGTAARATTEGTNTLDIFDGTAPVGTLANGISLYSTSGELRVMDAAGNATLLSPHDPQTNEWIYFSKNTVTGKVLRVDMERLMKAIDAQLGGGFIKEYVEKVN